MDSSKIMDGLRRAIKWLIGGALLFIVAPVVAKFAEELAQEIGLLDEPIAKLTAALAFIEPVTGNPLFPWVAGGLLGVAIGVWADDLIRQFGQRQNGSETSALGDDEADGFDLAAQQQLVRVLRDIGKYDDEPRPDAKISLAVAIHVPLGKALKSAFDLAGWTTRFNETPQEPFTHQYREGIEVRGWNELVVKSVSDALAAAGLPDIRPNVLESEFGPDNPNWTYIQRRVRIFIGHTKKYG